MFRASNGYQPEFLNYMQKLNVEYLGIYRSLIHLQPFKDIYCISIIPVMYSSFDLAKSFHMQQSVHTSIQIICSINPFTHAKWPSSLQNQHVSDFLLAVPTICASLWDGQLSCVTSLYSWREDIHFLSLRLSFLLSMLPFLMGILF